MSDYLHSPLRRAKRGLLANQLRLYQFKQAQANGQPINIKYLRCQLCDVQCQPEAMHFHEIVARGLMGNKEALEYLPVEYHSLLCPPCNLSRADHQVSRQILFQYSIRMWGKEVVKKATDEFNDLLISMGGSPISPMVIDYSLLE